MKRIVFFLCLIVVSRAVAADLLLIAEEASLKPLIAKLEASSKETTAVWTFWKGQLAGKDVVLACSEGDPLNAVAATTLAIRRYAPKLIVTFGTARPHDPSLKDGDIVVSEHFAAFDGMVSPHEELGTGSRPLTWHKLLHPVMTAGEGETSLDSFPADSAAANRATELTLPQTRIIKGVLGSAHQINREADRIAYLRSQWKTDTEDMESAHVAMCAYMLSTPVVGFRVVNGTADTAAAFTLKFVEASK